MPSPFTHSRIAALEAELAELSSSEDSSEDAEDADAVGRVKDHTTHEANGSRVPRGKESSMKTPPANMTNEAEQVPSLHCAICGVSVTSVQLMREHLQGRKHAAALKLHEARAEGRYCNCCQLTFTSQAQLAEHAKGRRHKEQAQCVRIGASSSSANSQPHDRSRPSFSKGIDKHSKARRAVGNGRIGPSGL